VRILSRAPQNQQTSSETVVSPAIFVNLDLFWGKKYLDFKNFSSFVKPPKDKKPSGKSVLIFCLEGLATGVAKKSGLGSLTCVFLLFLHQKVTASSSEKRY
jgi:hypothetical protein